jgi:hypothetical protein
MDDDDPYFGKKAQRKAVVDWVTRALEGVVNGLMCGDLYDDCPGAFSGSLDEALRLASWGDEKKLHRAVNLATLSMGQVAYNIKSRLFPRIVALRTEYRNRLRVNGSMKHFAKEFSKCYDLLYTELECMPARKKVRIWASYPEGQEEFREFDVEYFFPYSGMSPEEATRKSRNIAVRNHKKEYGKGEYTELAKAMAEVFKLLSQEAEKGLAGRALPHMTANIIKRILNHGGELIWESYKEIPENLLPHEIHGEEVTEETVESRARASVIDAMRRYFASASNLAVHTGSDAAAMFSELSSLLECESEWCKEPLSRESKLQLAEFIDTLDKARDVLHHDVAIAKLGAKPPMPVEVADDSVKKLAGATGVAVKKAIKPGRGSKNVRYPNETKEQCLRIWGNKDYREAAKHHIANGRKITYEAVFEVAKNELAKLRPMPITTLVEFKRALGAKSDKKYRDSPAVRKKNRDKKRQAVYLPHSDFLSSALKDRHR